MHGDLHTEDYSAELDSRLERLSINEPEVANEFWNRVESDDNYLWGGLLTDQVVLAAAEKVDLHDAMEWLRGSSPQKERFFSWPEDSNKAAIAKVEELQRHGIGEVLVYDIERGDDAKGGHWSRARVIIRLPADPALRSKAFATLFVLDQLDNPEATQRVDYGQRYVNAP